jgi:hypothetical protein
MRSIIIMATTFSLSASLSFAQVDLQPPKELVTQQLPPGHSEPARPPTTPAPKLPDASFTEQQAKAKFESDGYTVISGLKKDDKGMWTATAMKEGRPVQLSLDTQGQIIVAN